METIDQLLNTAFAQLKTTIANNIERSGKRATGNTAESISYSVKDGNATLDAPPWLATLESGRAPAKGGGSAQSNFRQDLKDWIQAKGINVGSADELERLARFLQWHINKFGTRQYRQGKHVDIYTTAFAEFEENITEQICKLCEDEINKML